MGIIADLVLWITELDASFAFLLALPFVVAAVGLLASHQESRGGRREARAGAADRAPGHPAHVR
ncbi:MAG: hypothetical protein IT515_18150 [Burkholderiales bacterium]|nr:hypothetical protein [Burkholderiales bacterium]